MAGLFTSRFRKGLAFRAPTRDKYEHSHLGIIAGQPIRPSYQVRVRKSFWVRAEVGGILRFHVSPGEPVCHVGVPTSLPRQLRQILAGERKGGLTGPVRRDFSRSLSVTEREEPEAEPTGTDED